MVEHTNPRGGEIRKATQFVLFSLFALGLVLALSTGAAAETNNETIDEWPLTEGATVNAGDGATVELGTGLWIDRQHPFPDDQTIDLRPEVRFEGGDGSFLRYQGHQADQFVHVDNLDLASQTTIQHETHGEVSIDGSVDAFAWRQPDPQSESADLKFAGSYLVATVEVDEPVIAKHTETDEVLDVGALDDGTATLHLQGDGSWTEVTLVEVDEPTEFSNPSPADGADGDREQLLEIDVYSPLLEDDVEDDHSVDVRFLDGDGNVIGEETITENQRVSTMYEAHAGTNYWAVEAEDSLGQVSHYGDYQFRAPVILNIRDGHDLEEPFEEDVDVRITSVESDSDYQEDLIVSDGEIALDDVPDEVLSVDVDHDNYQSQRVVIPQPYGTVDHYAIIYDDEDPDVFRQCYELDSRGSGFAPENSWVNVKTYIDGSWSPSAGAFFGAANQGCIGLLDGEEHRLEIGDYQDTRSIGGYTADQEFADQLVPLRVDGVRLNLDRGDVYRWEVTSERNEETEDGDVIFRFVPGDADVHDLEVVVYERHNESNVLGEDSWPGTVTNTAANFPVDADDSHKTWVVEWTATVDGEVIEGSDTTSVDRSDIGIGLGDTWTPIFAGGLLLIIAGIFGAVHAPAGGVVVVATAGVFNLIGLLDIPTLVLSLALSIAILGFVAAKTRGGI